MDYRKRRVRIRYVKPFDYSKVKPLTADEAGLDSPERRKFWEEQKAKAPEWDKYLATVDLSHLGSKVGSSSQNSMKLRKLIREAIALKKRLEAHMKNHNTNKDSKKLLNSLGNVIRLVTQYYEATMDLPFDWIKKSFLRSVPRGSKLSYPDEKSDNLPEAAEPAVTYVLSDDDECETVNVRESVEGPLKGPSFTRMTRVHPGIYRHLVYAYLRMGHGVQHFHNKDEEELWLEFRKLDRGIREAEVTSPEFVNEKRRSIEADHPIVNLVGNFAVAAFNKACNKHVKSGEHNNLHDFEFMECTYVKAYQFYHFYLIIEGFEEGNIGTYLAEVVCNSFDGARVLCKFVLTDYEPSGTKAMAASYLSCLKSISNTMNDLYKEKLSRLSELQRSLKEPERGVAMSEIYRLKGVHVKFWEGLLTKHREHTRFHFPPDCKRRTNPALWSVPEYDCCNGMVLRGKCTTSSGYDYYNPYFHGSG